MREREREKLAMRTRNEGGMILRNNGRRKDIGKICKVLRERERRNFGVKGEVEGRKQEREAGRRRGGRGRRFRVRTTHRMTGRWTTMRVAAGVRKKEERREGGRENTKVRGRRGKVSARARGIRVVEKGAKRLPDVPPEEKRWKY